MRVLGRVGSAVVAAIAGAALLVPAPPAGTSPARGDELAVAKQRVSEARAAATAAAGRVTEAYGEVQALGDEIIAVEGRIADAKARAEELRTVVARRARQAYTDSSGESLPVLVESDEPRDVARRTEYLDRMNARDNAVVGELRALDEDLAVQRSALDEARAQRVKTLEQLKAEQVKLEALLAEAEAAQVALEERLARE